MELNVNSFHWGHGRRSMDNEDRQSPLISTYVVICFSCCVLSMHVTERRNRLWWLLIRWRVHHICANKLVFDLARFLGGPGRYNAITTSETMLRTSLQRRTQNVFDEAGRVVVTDGVIRVHTRRRPHVRGGRTLVRPLRLAVRERRLNITYIRRIKNNTYTSYVYTCIVIQ